jgi:hypothetical protein
MTRSFWRIPLLLVLMGLAASAVTTQWQTWAGGASGSTAPNRPAPCLAGTAVPILPSPHIAWSEGGSVRYNSVPPTSGPHVGLTLAPGIYSTMVPDVLAVHALEHGHVVIRYAPDLTADTLAQLQSVAKRFAADIILAPYTGLPNRIALTAWGRIDLLTDYDYSRIERFIVELRGRYNHEWTRNDPC